MNKLLKTYQFVVVVDLEDSSVPYSLPDCPCSFALQRRSNIKFYGEEHFIHSQNHHVP